MSRCTQLPDGPRLLDPFQPEQETSTESAKVVESTFPNVRFADFAKLKLPDLVKLVALNHDFPDVGTDRLLDLVTTYGLRDVVKSLQLLDSLGPMPAPAAPPPEAQLSALAAAPAPPDPPSSPGGETDAGSAGDSGGGSSGGSPGGE